MTTPELEPMLDGTTTTTLTFAQSPRIWRGDVLQYGDGSCWRVTCGTAFTLTVRPVHQWAWLEALRYAWERWVVWPVRDRLSA